MPIPKRTALAARNGGNLPRDPANLKRGSGLPEPPTSLAAVPPPKTQVPGGAAEGSLTIITVRYCSIKERTDKQVAAGKPAAYRSCGGSGQDGKEYWWPTEMNDKKLSPGDVVLVEGEIRAPFGDDKDIYPIDTVSCQPYVEKGAESVEDAKVPPVSSDELVKDLAVLVKEHGIAGVLRAAADLIDPA